MVFSLHIHIIEVCGLLRLFIQSPNDQVYQICHASLVCSLSIIGFFYFFVFPLDKYLVSKLSKNKVFNVIFSFLMRFPFEKCIVKTEDITEWNISQKTFCL